MRKFLFTAMLVLCVCLCAIASAQTLTFGDLQAGCAVPDDYILLKPDNLDRHTEFLANRGITQEALLADWAARGVLAQAWAPAGDACLEFTAIQDELAQQYFDIDQQTPQVRAAYRTAHLKGKEYKAQGYTYQSAEWKKYSEIGRFLMLKYKRSIDGETIRGYARRTIRNGYTITLDYQVYGRNLKSADSKALTKVLESWRFTKTEVKPAEVAAKVKLTTQPPMETNTGKFTVEGVCEEGMQLIGVVMRMSSPDPIVLETTAGKKGKFSMDVQLPAEGVWMMTMTAENAGIVTEELVFGTTTYKKNLLPVNFSEDMPLDFDITEVQTLSGDKLVISGTTMKGVKVQCLVDGRYDKQVTTNNSGKFSFSINTAEEGQYDITLAMQKKNYASRRFTATAVRRLTEADIQNHIREDAVKPAYTQLTKKLNGYTDRYMVYTMYVTGVEQDAEGQWVIRMAMRRTKAGEYRDIVYVVTDQEPNLSVDSQHKLYGKCIGSYEADDKSYPCIELAFWD